jgi:RecA-family ATPase
MSPFDMSPEERMRAAGGKTETRNPPPEKPTVHQESGGKNLPPLRVINPADLLHVAVPPQDWIVPDWLPVGCTTANYGDGGVGKTLLSEQLMTSCVTNIPWCGYAVKQVRSFGLFCEDDENELHRRQDRICDHLRINMGMLGNMRWVSGVGEDNLLCTFSSAGKMLITDRYYQIREAILEFGAQLVVLDTAADTFGGNENDRSQVRRFIGLLNRLAMDIDGGVLLNAHPSRAGLRSGDLDGASTAWNNSVRSRWALARPTDSNGEEQMDTSERVLTRKKANYAEIGATIKLRWANGAFAPIGSDGSINGNSISRDVAEIVFLDLLDRCGEQQQWVSQSSRASNYAPKVFKKRPDSQGYSVREFEYAMSSLFTKKKLRNENYGRISDLRQRIARDSAACNDP